MVVAMVVTRVVARVVAARMVASVVVARVIARVVIARVVVAGVVTRVVVASVVNARMGPSVGVERHTNKKKARFLYCTQLEQVDLCVHDFGKIHG